MAAQTAGGGLRLTLDDGSVRRADHVLCATGFRVDVRRLGLLGPRLLDTLDLAGGYPRLGSGFEANVPGLHFVGAPAAWSWGPLARFVAGSGFAARELTARLTAAVG
jgi:hypothetical protein